MIAIQQGNQRGAGDTEKTPWDSLFASDAAQLGPDVAGLIEADRSLEENTINLIASAAYAPLGLRQIEGTHLVNHAPMGLPRKRSVAGCEFLDEIEELAVSRAIKVFGSEYANVQALSSTIANVAVLNVALPRENACLLAFDELAGGHVSHGSSRHITGAGRRVVTFSVDADGLPDYEEARKVALRERPQAIVVGASTYPREIDFQKLRSIASDVGALLITDIAHTAGLIVAGLHANPVPYSDFATTSTQKTLCGPRNGAFIFCCQQYSDAIDAAIYPGLQGPAGANLIAARAVQLDMIQGTPFKTLMKEVVANAQALAESLQEHGISLYAGGTDSHMVVCYADDGWTSPALTHAFGTHRVSINAIRAPGSDRKPRQAFRIGTVAMTIRGFDAAAFRLLGRSIAQIVQEGPERGLIPHTHVTLSEMAMLHPVPSFVD
jgi:glycine hydroxymethyltransferase